MDLSLDLKLKKQYKVLLIIFKRDNKSIVSFSYTPQ